MGGLEINRPGIAPPPSVTTAPEEQAAARGLSGGLLPTIKRRTRGAARGHEPGRPLIAATEVPLVFSTAGKLSSVGIPPGPQPSDGAADTVLQSASSGRVSLGGRRQASRLKWTQVSVGTRSYLSRIFFVYVSQIGLRKKKSCVLPSF